MRISSENKLVVHTLLLHVMLLYFQLGFSQSSTYYQLAKAYASLQYFYPNPQAAQLEWDNFLIHQIDEILNERFQLESACQAIAPEVSFSSSSTKDTGQLPHDSLVNNYYYQHFGGLETVLGSSKDELMKSLLIGDDMKSFSMLFRFVPMSDRIKHKVKLSFRAKWISETNNGSALVMLHSGFKKSGKMNDRFHRVTITPSPDWKYYELDSIFCSDCPDKVYNALKIVRSEYGTLLIDDLCIYDATTRDTIFFHDFENFDEKYNQYTEYQSFILSEKIAPQPSEDSYRGKYALQLIGNKHLQLYEQARLDSLIQVQLAADYGLKFPRFLNRHHHYSAIDEQLSFYQNINKEDYPERVHYLADIIKLWTIAENTYPYTSLRKGIDAKALFDFCISNALQDDYNATKHFHNIVYLHSAYRDPHLNPFWVGKTPMQPPVIPQIVDDEYRIGLIYDEQYASYFGQKVTQINGINTDDWLAERLYDKSAINSKHLLNNALRYFFYSFDVLQNYRLTLENGENLIFNIEDLIEKQEPVRSPFSHLQDTIEIFNNGQAAYLRISPFGKWDKRNEERGRFIVDSLAKCSWIILDFRDNHINYTSQRIIEYKKRANDISTLPDHNSIIDQPFKDSFDYVALNLFDIARYETKFAAYPPQLIALVNENTRSAPERHLLPLYDAGLVTLIGQATAGTAAFSNKLQLPSGIKVSFTMGKTTYQSGASYQDNGIQPHYLITNTLSDQDLGLLKAKELIAK